MIANFSLYFFIYIFFTYIFYFAGRAFLKIFKIELQGDFTNIFFSLLLGATFVATLFAIFMTKLQTVMLINVFIGLMFVFFNKKNALPKSNEIFSVAPTSKKYVFLYCSMIQITTFMWCFYMITKANGYLFQIPHSDLFHYAKISDYINLTAKENTSHINNLLNEYLAPKAPYHYYELWLTNLITKPFGLNSLQTLLSVTTPLFLTATSIAYLAFWEKYGKITPVKVLTSLLFLFIGGIFFEFYQQIKILRYLDSFAATFLLQAWKYGPYYLFICGFVIAIIQKEFLLAMTTLLFLSVATITAAPAVFGGLIMTNIIFLLLGNKKTDVTKKEVYQALLMIFISLLLFAYTYLFNNQAIAISEKPNSFNFKEIFILSNLKTSINIILGTIINVFIAFLPLFALIGYFLFAKNQVFKKQYHINLITLFAILASGLIGWSLFAFYSVDANQLFLLISSVILNILFVFYLVKFFSTPFNIPFFKGIIAVFMTLLLVINIYKNSTDNFFYSSPKKYSDDYLNKITTLLQSHQNLKLGGILFGKDDYNTIFMKTTTTSGAGIYLGFMNNNMIATSMSDYEIPVSSDTILAKKEMRGISGGSFYQFVQKQKKKQLFKSVVKSKLDYIDQNNIGFMIISPNAIIEDSIQSRFKIVIQDTLSKEKFILLKKND